MVMVSVWMWVVVGVCHAQGHGRVPREVMGGGGLEGEGVRGEGVGGNEGMVVRPQGEDLACFHHIGAVLRLPRLLTHLGRVRAGNTADWR